MNRIRWYGPTVALLITILAVLLAGPPVARQLAYEYDAAKIVHVRDSQKANPSLAELSDAFKKVAKIVEKSVVSIEVYSKKRAAGNAELEDQLRKHFFGPDGLQPRGRSGEKQDEFEDYDVPQQYGNGSGWVYDDKGHLITNNHVVDGADRIVVRFHDGSERDATIVGVDAKTDVAVIKVKGDKLHPAARSKETVDQGEIVFAFGSPFRFEFSMSQGIVSAKGRQLGILRGNQGYENFIQTDAAINPGNSGGPLTNIYGEVVGMNTAIASRTGSYNGLGFAIPIKMVENVADQIIEKGKVSRGYLGVYIRDLTPQLGKSFGYEGKGVLVENPIEGSPGEKAGMKRGDIITKIDDHPVTTADELRGYVAEQKPGAKLKVEIHRLENPTDTKGKTLMLDVIIEEQPAQSVAGRIAPGAADDHPEAKVLGKAGIEAETMTEDLSRQLGVKFVKGALVTRVRPGSAAEAAGLTRGLIVTDVMGKPITDVKSLTAELGKHDLNQGVRISVTDGEAQRFVFLELPKK